VEGHDKKIFTGVCPLPLSNSFRRQRATVLSGDVHLKGRPFKISVVEPLKPRL